MPGLTDEPAWPTLRAHLLLLAAHGADPLAQLAHRSCSRELDSADDRAAVLTGGSTTPASTTGPRRCRGCPAFPTGSPTILTGDPI